MTLKKTLLFGGLILLLFGSCHNDDTVVLDRETLFTLELGKMEDQIDLIQLSDEVSREQTRLTMRSGLFYLLNGDAGKIMEFNSYGDILSLFYNSEQNPEPVLLSPQTGSSQTQEANRLAFSFPFRSLSHMAVTADREVLAVDQVAPQRMERDPDTDAAWYQMVLRFDSDGELKDVLGQEGIGGTPFPHVENLLITDRDEPVVITQGLTKWMVFWFTRQGVLKYKLEIPLDQLPGPDEENLLISFDSVFPSRTESKLFLKMDYSQVAGADSGDSHMGPVFLKSMIYEYDLTTGTYSGFFDIPRNYVEGSGAGIFETHRYEMLYEFLGVGAKDRLFFISSSGKDQQEVLIMDLRGRPLKRVLIHVSDQEVYYRDFALSDQGILSALLVRDYAAEVCWWRTDKLIGDR